MGPDKGRNTPDGGRRIYFCNIKPNSVYVMVVTLCIGLATPPVGINLFVASSVGGQPIHKIIPHLPVLIASIIAGTIAIVLIPGISTLLPALMK